LFEAPHGIRVRRHSASGLRDRRLARSIRAARVGAGLRLASGRRPFRLSAFPDNANHQHLSLLLLILVLLADSRGSDDERNALAALQSMRWIAVIGVFWAGVMKLFYGYWLGGEFLAFRVAGNSGFTQVLGLLVSREEGSPCWVSEWILGPGPFAPMLRF
jgi:hypothetical protein